MNRWMWILGMSILFIAVTSGCQAPAAVSAPDDNDNNIEILKASEVMQPSVVLLAEPEKEAQSWNLALGQPVSASGYDEGLFPEYMTDGLYDPFLTPPQCWRMSDDQPGWIEITFPTKSVIQQIELMVGPNAIGVPFSVSARLSEAEIHDLGMFDTKPDTLGIMTAPLPKPEEGVTGVRIDMLDPSYPCIYEVAVVGRFDEVVPDSPSLETAGDPEVVFDWTTDRCEDENIPDLPARAFRDSSDQVNLILSGYINYRMIGPHLDSVAIDCNAIMDSAREADPALYNDTDWIAAPYTEDGQTVYSLVHHEYHGHEHPGMCPPNDYFLCWFNQITMAISTDSGVSYSHIADAPDHLVASLPIPYEAGRGTIGLRNPSNIINRAESNGSGEFIDTYYSFMNAISDEDLIPAPGRDQWVCLMRTQDLADPSSWRFWNGTGFEGRFIDPYIESPPDPTQHRCAPLDWDDIGASMNESIIYSPILHRYILTGISADHIGERDVWGVYYAFSDDLIEWTHRRLLLEMPLPWTVPDAGMDLSYLYPSLLDPSSTSRNFETTDLTAYLYLTRHNFGQGHLDRDLIRFPVQIVISP